MSISVRRVNAGSQTRSSNRFRASLISSASVHVSVLLGAIFAPWLMPRAVIMPDFVPVQFVAPPPPTVQAPEPEPEPEAELEPPAAYVSEPEPIPRSIRDLRRRQEEAEAERRRREEQRQRQLEEEERRRREAEAEARRKQPQKAGKRPEAPTTQRAARSEIAFTGTEANQTSFTIEDFPFAYYVAQIRDKVSREWRPPPRPAFSQVRQVQVFFRIGRDGRLIIQPSVATTSGDTLYDQAAMRAIASAAPFPPLPSNYEGQSLGVRFAFTQE